MYSISCSSAFFKIGNHWNNLNSKYIFNNLKIIHGSQFSNKLNYKRRKFRHGILEYTRIMEPIMMKQFDLHLSVLATYIIPASKLNVRPRFEPQIVYFHCFMHFWPLEDQKFKAKKWEQLGTRIRFSQLCLIMAKNDFSTWYPHHTDQHHRDVITCRNLRCSRKGTSP